MIHLPAAFSLDEIRCEIFVMDPEFSPAWTTEFLIIELMMRLSHWRWEGSCARSCRNHAGPDWIPGLHRLQVASPIW